MVRPSSTPPTPFFTLSLLREREGGSRSLSPSKPPASTLCLPRHIGLVYADPIHPLFEPNSKARDCELWERRLSDLRRETDGKVEKDEE